MQLVSFIILISLALATCVPQSVLVKDSLAEHNYKVKRSSSSNDNEIPLQKSSKQITGKPINKNSEIDIELPLSSSIDVGLKQPSSSSSSSSELNSNYQKGSLSSDNNNVEEFNLYNGLKGKSPLHKRGVNSQLLYGSDFYNPAISSGREDGGVWGDEIDPSYLYASDSDLDDYPVRGQYRNKPYDNLQNILNSETNYRQEPLALPIQYYLNDRRKRSNKYKNGYDMRLKRDSSAKLTPADMLALVALVEAGERDDLDYNKPSSYYPSPSSSYYPSASSSYYPSTSYSSSSDNDMLNSWTLPLENDNNEQGYYSGMPYNLENIPRYEILREQKYSPSRYENSKRFMVSKKKRSLGHFYNEPISKPSISYSPPSQQQIIGKGPKKLKNYI